MHDIVLGAKSVQVREAKESSELSAQKADALLEQLRFSPRDEMRGLETGQAFARRARRVDQIKYAKLHARLSDPRLQREKVRLPFFPNFQ